MKEKMYKIFYGENEGDYIRRFLKDDEIIDGRLTEAKAFDVFFNNMIMCNNYLEYRYNYVDDIISPYDEEEDYYIDEYQLFIIDIEYNKEITTKAIKKMGNTFYYDNDLDLYIMGVTDLGTSRRIVPTSIIVKEEKGDENYE